MTLCNPKSWLECAEARIRLSTRSMPIREHIRFSSASAKVAS